MKHIGSRIAFITLCGSLVVGALRLAAAQDTQPTGQPVGAPAASQPTSAPFGGEPPDASQPWLRERAGGILGSKHDFSNDGRIGRDLCLPCHTPHIAATQAPLLTERGASNDPVRAYGTKAAQLDAASLVCLSCHDGTVARDVYAGSHAMTWSDRSVGGVAPGASRLTNHPVGIEYPDGREKYASSAAVTSDGWVKLPGGRIQCTTCHDPHNSRRIPKMLVISNERSKLCLTCHRL